METTAGNQTYHARVDLLCAAGRFLQVEFGWSVSDPLTRLAATSIPGVLEQGLAHQVQDHEVAIVELDREVQELRLFCLDEGKKRNTVNRCEIVHRCESSSTKTDAGEEFVFMEPWLSSISWCVNRVFDELDACFAEYHVSQGFGADPDVVLPLMAVQEDLQNKRGSESDTTEDANVNEDTAVEVPLPQSLKETVEVTEYVAPASAVTDTAPAPVTENETVEVPMPQILNEAVEVTEYVAPASAVTDTAPAPVTENVAPTIAFTFDETAPVIECVAPSLAVSTGTKKSSICLGALMSSRGSSPRVNSNTL